MRDPIVVGHTESAFSQVHPVVQSSFMAQRSIDLMRSISSNQYAFQVFVMSKDVRFCFPLDDPLVVERLDRLENRMLWLKR